MFYFVLAAILACFLALQIPSPTFSEPPGVAWQGMQRLAGEKTKPAAGATGRQALSAGTLRYSYNGLYQPPLGGGPARLLLPGRAARSLDPDQRSFIPFLGFGYLLYRKVGAQVEYRSIKGELLWRKSFRSYPVGDPTGKLLLFLSGDNNRVEITDENGQSIGERMLAGNFLTDYDFARGLPAAALTFAGGSVYLVDKTGRAVIRTHLAPVRQDQARIFLKSTAISPDGKLMAVHLNHSGQDRIQVLAVSSKPDRPRKVFDIPLDRAYPHKIHLAVNRHGLLAATPERTMFFDADGDLLNVMAVPASARRIYRPVHAGDTFFAHGSAGDAVILDAKGRIAGRLQLGSTAAHRPWRFLGGRKTDELLVQTHDRLHLLKIAAGAD